MTPEEKRTMLEFLSLDQLAYILQMVIDEEPRWQVQMKIRDFAMTNAKTS